MCLIYIILLVVAMEAVSVSPALLLCRSLYSPVVASEGMLGGDEVRGQSPLEWDLGSPYEKGQKI